MAMIMSGLYLGWLRATGPPQRPFLGEDVARCEFGRACEGQVFAHGVRRRRRCEPWTGQTACRTGNPVWDPAEPTLLCQIFGDGADKRIKPDVTSQFRLALDRRIAVIVGFCQIERVNELGELDVLRRTGLNPFNRFSEGIWAHRFLLATHVLQQKSLLFGRSSTYREVSAKQGYCLFAGRDAHDLHQIQNIEPLRFAAYRVQDPRSL